MSHSIRLIRLGSPGCAIMLAALLAGCLQRQPGEQQEVTPDTTQLEAALVPRCEHGSAQAIALLRPPAELDSCGLVLERDGDGGSQIDGEGQQQLLVRALARAGEGERDPEPVLLGRGLAPKACGPALERCELWGVSDALGPLVLASVRGHESDMPIQVYVGWIEGERLVFAETWYGLSAVVDHTRIGPPWVLAPFDCEGELMLLPAARLPEAQVESPDASLRALAGRWVVDEAGIALPPAPGATADPADCRPLIPALP